MRRQPAAHDRQGRVVVETGMTVQVEFCGEWFDVNPDEAFLIGREGDLEIDDNPYLHRRFLTISRHDDLWWLENVGSRLSATVADADGNMQAWLAPGARLPLVFAHTSVLFTAGPTTYEIGIVEIGRASCRERVKSGEGDGTVRREIVGERGEGERGVTACGM